MNAGAGVEDHRIAPAEVVRDLDVAVVGTGFSGLGMAIRLLAAGEKDFLVFERADEVGGTWRDNSYPGAACDVQAHLYSFSFAPNPNWGSTFGTRDELYTYLNDCATRFGVRPHIRFRHELLEATWDVASRRWNVLTSAGLYTARVLVSGMGYLSEPNIPAIAGLDTFEGPWFHSSRWDHGVDLHGKRVAVIGTGASAIQIIPEIQPLVAQLDVYQRTPPWVAAKPDHLNLGFQAWALRRMPGYQSFRRNFNKWGREVLSFAMRRPALMAKMQSMASGHLEKSVADPELRERLRPDYVMGCKRLLFSNTYYQALQRSTVSVVTDPIGEMGPNAIATADGTLRPTDVVVLATGFRATQLPFAERIRGVGGRSLAVAWSDHQYAYLGSTVPGFPNFFMLLGPNTTLGHSSMTLMSEAQVEYAVDAVRTMKKKGLGAVDVRPEVVTAYGEKLQADLARSVWNAGGCRSWYVDAGGRNTTIWPRSTRRFRKLTRRFAVGDYITADPVPRPARAAGARVEVGR